MGMTVIDLKLTLQTPTHIGQGVPFVRDNRGRPLLSAATLKGMHRAATEKLAAGLGFTVCDAPVPEHMCHPLRGLCVVCQIFGSPSVPGRIFCHPLTTSAVPIGVEVARTSLSRRRRLYQTTTHSAYEVLPAGTTFTGEIKHLIGSKPLLALGLAALRTIQSIGSANSIGYGLCSVEATALDSSQMPISDRELADALKDLK